MPSRVALNCRFILCFLIIFICTPNSGILAQDVENTNPPGINEPTGEIGTSKVNQEAIDKLRRMSPGEIKALE